MVSLALPNTSPFSWKAWWTSLDKPLAYVFLGLIVIGLTLSMAAGPVAAGRLEIDNPFHFVERQFIFLIPALTLMLGLSFLTLIQVRRAGVLLCGGALLLLILTRLIGPEINGAHRWLTFSGFSLQPSEFFKPGFVITAAWLLAESARDEKFPGGVISLAIFGFASLILLVQPDYGQLVLLTAVWGVVFFIAGWNWSWIMGLGAAVTGILAFGYNFTSHVRDRIDRFLAPETGDRYQVDKALEAISGGGLLGHDLNHSASVKYSVPDAHTDFIFAVAGEEFGFALCFLILALFATIIWRCLDHAGRTQSLFIRCAIAGLSAQLAFQAIVNIGVSLAVLPAKGMTLPFISYGGSSLLATGITAGFLLALTRQQHIVKP